MPVRLCDDLTKHFGSQTVFMDVAHINPGDDFVGVLTDAVGSCDVLIALIGRRWLTSTDTAGQRRLESPAELRSIGDYDCSRSKYSGSSCAGGRCSHAHPHASKTHFGMTGVTSASSKMGADENIQSTIHAGRMVSASLFSQILYIT